MDMNSMLALLNQMQGLQSKVRNPPWENRQGPTMARAAGGGGAMAKGGAPISNSTGGPMAPALSRNAGGTEADKIDAQIESIRQEMQMVRVQLYQAMRSENKPEEEALRQQLEDLQAQIDVLTDQKTALSEQGGTGLQMGTSSTGGNYAGKPRASRGRPENFGVGGASQIYRPWNR